MQATIWTKNLTGESPWDPPVLFTAILPVFLPDSHPFPRLSLNQQLKNRPFGDIITPSIFSFAPGAEVHLPISLFQERVFLRKEENHAQF